MSNKQYKHETHFQEISDRRWGGQYNITPTGEAYLQNRLKSLLRQAEAGLYGLRGTFYRGKTDKLSIRTMILQYLTERPATAAEILNHIHLRRLEVLEDLRDLSGRASQQLLILEKEGLIEHT